MNAATPRYLIKGQYVKDLSFENPHAPKHLMPSDGSPKIDLNVDFKAQRFDDEHFEVTIHIAVQAMGKENPLFVTELDYAAVVQLIDVPEDRIEPILFIDCAYLIFPFARRVLADITRDGGFPPLMIEPIDFAQLYAQNKVVKQSA